MKPSLIAEVDFTGHPSAGYFDRLRYQTGIQSYWRMNNAASLVDELGMNTGTTIATPTLGAGALPYDTDQALTFNGSSQYAVLPGGKGLSQAGSYTVEGWVKFPTLPSSKVIVENGAWTLMVDGTARFSWTVENDQSGTLTQTSITGTTVIQTGVWYHVAALHDADADLLSLYVNGRLEVSGAHSVGTEVDSAPGSFAGRLGGSAPVIPTNAGNVSGASPGSTSVACAKPASTADGDLLLAHFCYRAYTPTVVSAVPTGWNLLGHQGADPIGWNNVYYKVAASEPASWAWTLSANSLWAIVVTRITGYDTAGIFANPVYSYYSASMAGGQMSTRSHWPHSDNVLAVNCFGTLNYGSGAAEWSESRGSELYDFGAPNFPSFGIMQNVETVNRSSGAYSMTATATDGTNKPGAVTVVMVKGTGASLFTNASLDEWSFWTSALSADTIMEHYLTQYSGVGSWIDVSTDVMGASFHGGRQYELDRIEAGTGQVKLKDLQRKYDPANRSSPYWPNVTTMRKVRVRADVAGTNRYLFQHYVDSWPSEWGQGPRYAATNLSSVDGFAPLALVGLTGSLPAQTTGARVNAVLDLAAWSRADRVIDTGTFALAAATFTDTYALTHIQDVVDSELGVFFIDGQGRAVFHDYSHRWTQTRSITPQAVFSDDGSAGIAYHDLRPSLDVGRLVNEWAVTSANGTSYTIRDVQSLVDNFRRTETRTTLLDNPADALTQARALLQSTGSPWYRFDVLTVKLGNNLAAATWQQVLGLGISDRVTVKRNPVPTAGGTNISEDFFIEGVNIEIDPDLWTVTFQLSPVAHASYYDTIIRDQPVSYWRMDTVT